MSPEDIALAILARRTVRLRPFFFGEPVKTLLSPAIFQSLRPGRLEYSALSTSSPITVN